MRLKVSISECEALEKGHRPALSLHFPICKMGMLTVDI